MTELDTFTINRVDKMQDRVEHEAYSCVVDSITSHFGVDSVVDLDKAQIDEVATYGAHQSILLYQKTAEDSRRDIVMDTLLTLALNSIINVWGIHHNEEDYVYFDR
jgi:uncharacterized metal-binding protein|tara:strand:- start:61 stop:378 length:318 start_codon:yes stop_codon:yes gene_type:complete